MDATLPERIGARIKALRQAADLTQEQLAEKAGCTVSMVSMTERGLRTPSLEMLARIAVVLDPLRNHSVWGALKWVFAQDPES